MINDETTNVLEDAVKNCSYGCALERLSVRHGHGFGSLSEIATKHGFTEHEAAGIMDGWDAVEHGWGDTRGIFRAEYHGPDFGDGIRFEANVAEYDAGRVLGAKMAAIKFDYTGEG